jgi:hypothetical protein
MAALTWRQPAIMSEDQRMGRGFVWDGISPALEIDLLKSEFLSNAIMT